MITKPNKPQDNHGVTVAINASQPSKTCKPVQGTVQQSKNGSIICLNRYSNTTDFRL